MDRAEAFGQHPNADIAYQIEDSWLVLESLLSLQPQTALAAGGRSREDTVGAICADLLEQVRLQTRHHVSLHIFTALLILTSHVDQHGLPSLARPLHRNDLP